MEILDVGMVKPRDLLARGALFVATIVERVCFFACSAVYDPSHARE